MVKQNQSPEKLGYKHLLPCQSDTSAIYHGERKKLSNETNKVKQPSEKGTITLSYGPDKAKHKAKISYRLQ